ncbi:peptidoglycan D,D-transpeptidase FtsI family protein [Rubrobacter marinus]|uniref:peptidoglycan D,D-transpeptidase FtsI family protein n=1 Tax=Rubrobacter marinus TaxID=2653852 RepID=UPI001407D2B6|nr:penicillin-binding protein 2 [Rubrobacter marinus]
MELAGRGRRGRSSGTKPAAGDRARAVGRGRVRLAVGVVAVVCLSLGGRAVQLSVAGEGDAGLFTTEHRRVAAFEDRAERGAILSADGRQLATSLEASKIVATPYQVEDPRAAAEALAGVLDEEVAGVEEKLTRRDEGGALSGYSVVASGVEPEKSREILDLALPGVSVAPDAERVYPNGALASQTLGHLGADMAYGGVEASHEEALKSGDDVELTLDTAVQKELEGTLIETVKEHEAKSAVGIVMRVDDGAVVGMANVPGYDNNEFGEASGEAQRNRALTDPYEPGSTFKAFTMAAAIEEGAVTESSAFVIPDHMAVADRIINDSEPHETLTLDTGDILARSSNVGTVQVAQALGGEKLAEYIDRFGFGKATGVDLWGEDVGIVPPYEEWSGSSIGNIPIGQGLTVTPMQLAAGYAAIANGGLAVTPYVAEGSEPEDAGRRVISENTSSIVRGMLQGVVDGEEGTGELARIPGYSVAGKTGTAEKVDPETGLYGGGFFTSFVGFAPAQDPEYLTLVLVDDPQTTYWGEVVAAPAFQKVMSFTLSYMNVPPDRKDAAGPATNQYAAGGSR